MNNRVIVENKYLCVTSGSFASDVNYYHRFYRVTRGYMQHYPLYGSNMTLIDKIYQLQINIILYLFKKYYDETTQYWLYIEPYIGRQHINVHSAYSIVEKLPMDLVRYVYLFINLNIACQIQIPRRTWQTHSSRQTCGLFIPLNFWFAMNQNIASPIDALPYHEIRINEVNFNAEFDGDEINEVNFGADVNFTIPRMGDFFHDIQPRLTRPVVRPRYHHGSQSAASIVRHIARNFPEIPIMRMPPSQSSESYNIPDAIIHPRQPQYTMSMIRTVINRQESDIERYNKSNQIYPITMRQIQQRLHKKKIKDQRAYIRRHHRRKNIKYNIKPRRRIMNRRNNNRSGNKYVKNRE